MAVAVAVIVVGGPWVEARGRVSCGCGHGSDGVMTTDILIIDIIDI